MVVRVDTRTWSGYGAGLLASARKSYGKSRSCHPSSRSTPTALPVSGKGSSPVTCRWAWPRKSSSRWTRARTSPFKTGFCRVLDRLSAQLRPDGPECEPDVLDRVRVGEPQETLAPVAETGAGQGRHPGLLQQPGLQIGRGLAGLGDVREGVERALRLEAADAGNVVEAGHDDVPAAPELGHHLIDRIPRALQGGNRGVL